MFARISWAALVLVALWTAYAVHGEVIDTDQAVTGSNIIWGVFSFMVAVVYSIRAWYRRTWDETRVLMIGIACVAWGGFLHRAYWTTFRYLKAVDEKWWQVGTLWSDVLVPVVFLTCIGYLWHLSPLAKGVLGRTWLPVSLLSLYGVFWFGAWVTP